MNIYRELDPTAERRTQFAFKSKREHIAKVNIPNLTYTNQHIDIEIPLGSRDHVIVSDTVKITLKVLTLSQQTRSIFKNVGRALVKKKMIMLL